MAGRDGGLFVSPTERTIPNDPERTIATPRFDDKSVQAARAAVPLNLRTRVHSWPLSVVVTCVAVGLIGGALVGFALTYYFRDNPRETQQQAASEATVNSNDSTSATAPNATPAQSENASTQNSTNARSAAANTGAQPSNNAANDNATSANAGSEPAGAAPSSAKAGGDDSESATAEPDAGTRGELQAALGEWVAATNARDVDRQMDFDAPRVEDYYLTRNASREAVRAEKTRVFGKVDSVDVRASAPDIRLSRDGQTAVMRFRKQYQIGSGESGRSGAVLQELRWRRTPGGWKIVGERDLRVLQ
jgi:ketosteroid isomerase-like protein